MSRETRDGLVPRRTWDKEHIGTKQLASRENPGALIIEAEVRLKTLRAFGPEELARSVRPLTRDDCDAEARRDLWRWAHGGLDDALGLVLHDLARTAARLPPTDPAHHYICRAADRVTALINHVLGHDLTGDETPVGTPPPGEPPPRLSHQPEADEEHRRERLPEL